MPRTAEDMEWLMPAHDMAQQCQLPEAKHNSQADTEGRGSISSSSLDGTENLEDQH